MSGTTDQAKGRLKEAAGAITDDDKLRREGKLDQAVGKVKDAAEKALDAVTDKIKGKG
ncbi:MAG TPA: CsbD family protein [Candidatus Binatia bacterium]|nr:CsbD family protein [Candidatus Binatia bacterium]